MYRQGDVLIVPIQSTPVRLDAIGRDGGRVVLAHGEVTGHAHAIRADGAALYRDAELNVFLMVTGLDPVALEHAEHDTIMIPPGQYRVVRQREYSPEAVRDVAD